MGSIVDDNAVEKLGPLLQETELTQLVILLEAEAVKLGLLDGAQRDSSVFRIAPVI